MTDPQTPRRRRAHSFRQQIHDEINRRIRQREPLSIRAIIEAVGGGSKATVSDALASAARLHPSAVAALRAGNTDSPQGQIDLNFRLAELLRENASHIAERERLLQAITDQAKVVERQADTIRFLMARSDDTYRLMMTRADVFNQASLGVPILKAALEQAIAAKPEAPPAPEPDLLLQRRYEMQVEENVRLHRQLEAMRTEVETLKEAMLPPPPRGPARGVLSLFDEDEDRHA